MKKLLQASAAVLAGISIAVPGVVAAHTGSNEPPNEAVEKPGHSSERGKDFAGSRVVGPVEGILLVVPRRGAHGPLQVYRYQPALPAGGPGAAAAARDV